MKVSEVSSDKLPITEGSEYENKLKAKCKTRNLVNNPRDVGISPIIRFVESFKICSVLDNNPKVVGIDPVRSFPLTSNAVKVDIKPICVGIDPVKPRDDKLNPYHFIGTITL